jgi:hypothetical protein
MVYPILVMGGFPYREISQSIQQFVFDQEQRSSIGIDLEHQVQASSTKGACNGRGPLHAVSGLVDKTKAARCHGIPFFVDDALLVGGDLSRNATPPAKNVAACFHWCAATPPCERFTWTNSTGGTCWLKDASTQGLVEIKRIQSGYILHPTSTPT